MIYITLSILFFIVGLILRPAILKLIKKNFSQFFTSKLKRYEITFRIEYYSHPSIHHLGEEGSLVKTEPIKVQVDAESQDEALSSLDEIVKQEIKSELVAIKEITRL